MPRYLILSGILFMMIASQCKTKDSYTQSGEAEFSGKITNATAPNLAIDLDGEIQNITLNPDGSFESKFNIPTAGIYKIYLGNQGMSLPVYLQSGGITRLTADGTNIIMSAKFEGDTKTENSFLAAKMLNEPSFIQIDQTTLFTLPEEEFLKKAEEVKTKLIDFKKEFQKQNGVFNPHFEDIINQDIIFQVTNLKMYYPVYYNYILGTNDFSPSENFYSFFQSVDINNELNLNSDHFKVFVPLYVEHLAKIKNAGNDLYESSGVDKLTLLSEVITNQKIKEEISFQIMKQSFDTKLSDAFEMYSTYMNQSKDENKKKTIETIYHQWLPLKPGNKAPSFSGIDKNGKSFTSEKMVGKVLYIDVWATWCGPCLAELPHLEKLQEKFKNSGDISFVSISIDQNEEPWRKMLEAKNMKGVQLYSPGAWNSEIIANYRISGIPRFIIIDKEGNLVDGNATRPSNPATAEILEKLL